MLRRSVLTLSRHRFNARRIPNQATTQISPSLCFRRDFSSFSPLSKPPGARKWTTPQIMATGLVVGYGGSYLLDILYQRLKNAIGSQDGESDDASSEETLKQEGSLQYSHNTAEPLPVNTVDPLIEETKVLTESQRTVDSHDDSINLNPTSSSQDQVDELPKSSDGIEGQREEMYNSSTVRETSKDENLSTDVADKSYSVEQAGHGLLEANENLSTVTDAVTSLPVNSKNEANESLSTVTDAVTSLPVSSKNEDQPLEVKSQIEPKDTSGQEQEQSPSLLHTYSLDNESDERDSMLSEHSIKHSSHKAEASDGAFEDKDGRKLIVDFLQAIHAAEQRQAELDALVLAEEKRALKDKYEKELKDARARELMYAEEAAMLEKEIKKERAKAAAALKSLQERAEERLKMALEEKEREVEIKLKELEDVAKAELAASIAREKAAQIERMSEVNLNINALCMAFYARSEEARQTHSIHKLALGALALEDALSNGLPVQAELNALGVYIDNVDKDTLLKLAVASLPEDVRLHGTDSVLNLNQKFNTLKGSLRHYSLIPQDGGGILTHSLAHVASFLKVKEADQSGDGIESVINKVESLLAAGKLVEAADALEDGVKGSKASQVVGDWVRQVRNRAIAEQALGLLQSYATSMSLN